MEQPIIIVHREKATGTTFKQAANKLAQAIIDNAAYGACFNNDFIDKVRIEILRDHDISISGIAKRFGVTTKTIHNKLERFGIDRTRFRKNTGRFDMMED